MKSDLLYMINLKLCQSMLNLICLVKTTFDIYYLHYSVTYICIQSSTLMKHYLKN